MDDSRSYVKTAAEKAQGRAEIDVTMVAWEYWMKSNRLDIACGGTVCIGLSISWHLQAHRLIRRRTTSDGTSLVRIHLTLIHKPSGGCVSKARVTCAHRKSRPEYIALRERLPMTGVINVEGGAEWALPMGYARVSARDQNLDRQLDALVKFGVTNDNVFAEKASGKDFDRPEYLRLLDVLSEDDVLVIKSIDRLGRNYDEILEQWRAITKRVGAAIVVLDMPLLDTRERRDGLTNVLISDIVLQLLSYVAQVERENIRQRQAAGIAAARARGVRFGRPRMRCIGSKTLRGIRSILSFRQP